MHPQCHGTPIGATVLVATFKVKAHSSNIWNTFWGGTWPMNKNPELGSFELSGGFFLVPKCPSWGFHSLVMSFSRQTSCINKKPSRKNPGKTFQNSQRSKRNWMESSFQHFFWYWTNPTKNQPKLPQHQPTQKTSSHKPQSTQQNQRINQYVPGCKLPLFPYNRGWSSTH